MLIISTFEQTHEVEQALAVVEKIGIDQDDILVVPMEPYQENPDNLALRAADVKARAFEVGMVLATATGVIGSSIGFILKWGPIIWGIVYAIAGFVIGFGAVCLFRLMRGERVNFRSPKRPFPEIALIIQCDEAKSIEVCNVLWRYRAISVGKIA